MTREFLYEQYHIFKKSTAYIAKENNLPTKRIQYLMRKFNIERRSVKDAKRPIGSLNIQGHKWCPCCKKDKPFNEFSKGRKGQLDSYCKICCSKKAKKYIAGRNMKRQKTKVKLIEYFGDICADCKKNELPICMYTFHHHSESMKNPKYKQPAKVISLAQEELIKREKEKWIMLCMNCHSLRHSTFKLSAKKWLQRFHPQQ